MDALRETVLDTLEIESGMNVTQTPASARTPRQRRHSTSDTGERLPVLAMLRRRTHDDRASVRKAAVMALEAVSMLGGAALRCSNVQVLHERCQDAAMSVRKQALASLTALLNKFPFQSVSYICCVYRGGGSRYVYGYAIICVCVCKYASDQFSYGLRPCSL